MNPTKTNPDYPADPFGTLPLPSNPDAQRADARSQSESAAKDWPQWLSPNAGSREQIPSPNPSGSLPRPFPSIGSPIPSSVAHYSLPQSFASQIGPTASYSMASSLARPASSSPSGILPPASHLSYPRAWNPGSPESGQLPQVTSLAMPNAPLYYAPNSAWPARSFAPTNRAFAPTTHFRAGAPMISQQIMRPSSDPLSAWNAPTAYASAPSYESQAQYSMEHPLEGAEGWATPQIVRPRALNPQSADAFRPYFAAPQQDGIAIRPPNPGTPTSVIVAPKTPRPVGRPKKSAAGATPGPLAVAEPVVVTVQPPATTPARSRPPSTRRKSKSVLLQDLDTAGAVTAPQDETATAKKARKKKEQKSDTVERAGEGETSGSQESIPLADGEKKKKKYSAKTPAKAIPPPPDLGAGYGLRNKLPAGILFEEGERVEASDSTNTWYKARIVSVRKDVGQVYVHFEGWNARYDEWIPIYGKRIRQVTDEKFTEHQDRYKIGDIVVARWKGQENKPSVIIEGPSEQESDKYVVLAFDGSKRLLTSKALRRMSPVLRDRFQEELKQLNAVSANEPLLHHRRDIDSESCTTTYYQQPSELPSRSHHFPPAANNGAAALSQSTPSQPSLPLSPSQSVYPVPAIHSSPAAGFVVGAEAATTADMVESQYVKPKREPKKPLKFKDSVVEMGAKKKKKKKSEEEGVDNTRLESMVAQTEGLQTDHTGAVVPEPCANVPISVAPAQPVLPILKKHSPRLDISGESKSLEPSGAFRPISMDTVFENDTVVASSRSGWTNTQQSLPVGANSLMPSLFTSTVNSPAIPNFDQFQPNFPLTQAVGGPPNTSVLQSMLNDAHLENQMLSAMSGFDATSPRGGCSKSARPKQKTVAPKELVIQMDHNEFKCTVEDCNKSFRKQKLLKDHMKHYHNMTGDQLNIKSPSRKRKAEGTGADSSGNGAFSDFDPINIPGPLPEIPLDDPIFASNLGLSDISGDVPVFDGYFANSTYAVERKSRRRDSWDEFSVNASEENDDSGRKTRRKKKEESSDSEDVLQYIQQDHELVHCRCNYELENGFMVQCELCATWQHGQCYDMESLEDVPKHYVCDFCQTPKKIRFSQRKVCHDLQYLRSGRLPIFTPLPDDDDPLSGAHSSGAGQSSNRYLYRKLVADTVHCSEQLKAVKRIERAIFAVEEAQVKTDILVDGLCKNRTELSKLNNSLLNIPEDLVKGMNFKDILDKFGQDISDTDDTKIEKDDKMNLENIPELFPMVKINGVYECIDDGTSVRRGGINHDIGEYNAEQLENDSDSQNALTAEDLEADIDDKDNTLMQLNGPASPLFLHSPDLRASRSPEIPAIPPRVLRSGEDGRRLSVPDGRNGLHMLGDASQSPSSFSARAFMEDRPDRPERSDGVSDGEGLPSVGASSDGSAMDDLMVLAPELDPEVLALCSQFGEFGTLIKGVLSRGEATGKLMEKIASSILELEKECDARYGTNFANTPHLAEKEAEEYKQKLIRQQGDLRNMERLAYVIDIETQERVPQHRQMPGPLPIPPYPSLASSPAKQKGKSASGKSRKPKDPNAPKKPRPNKKKLKTESSPTDVEGVSSTSLPTPKTPESMEIM